MPKTSGLPPLQALQQEHDALHAKYNALAEFAEIFLRSVGGEMTYATSMGEGLRRDIRITNSGGKTKVIVGQKADGDWNPQVVFKDIMHKDALREVAETLLSMGISGSGDVKDIDGAAVKAVYQFVDQAEEVFAEIQAEQARQAKAEREEAELEAKKVRQAARAAKPRKRRETRRG